MKTVYIVLCHDVDGISVDKVFLSYEAADKYSEKMNKHSLKHHFGCSYYVQHEEVE